MKRYYIVVTGAVIAFGIALSQVGVASAAEPVAVRVVGGESAVPAAPVSDASVIAEGLGISVQKARTDYAGQQEFLAAVTVAYRTHPDLFFSSAWTPDKRQSHGYVAWVSFAGVPSAKTIAIFRALPVKVELRFDAPASAEALEPVRRKTMAALYDSSPGISGMTGDFEDDGDLVVEYELPASGPKIATPSFSPQALAAVAAIERTALIDVIVRQSSNASFEPEVVRGGVPSGSCTLGFAGRRGSQSGAVTAAHCPDSSFTPTGSSTSMPYVTGHFGAYGDAQFHSTTDGLSSSIRISSAGALRQIRAVAYPSNGAQICNYGKTRSNFACTTIRNWNHAFTAENGVYLSRMAQSNGTFTNAGDSGGPWFVGGDAVGVHYGKSGGYSTMSRVPDVEAILSFSVARG